MIKIGSRTWIIGLVAVAALLVAGALTFWAFSGAPPSNEPLPHAVTVRTIQDPGEAEHAEAIGSLISGLPQQFAAGDMSSLAEQARDEFGDVADALPVGSVLTVDQATYRRTGSVASVVATLAAPGEPTESYLVVVGYENGSWRIVSTVVVPE